MTQRNRGHSSHISVTAGAGQPPHVGTTGPEVELHPSREKVVAAGLSEFQRIFQEKDDALRDLSEEREKFKLAELEVDRLTTEVERLNSENSELRRTAMQATAERVAYETIFALVRDQMISFTLPTEPAKTKPAERPEEPKTV